MTVATDWKAARVWCAREFRRRHPDRAHEHASFLANELLEEAIERFSLPGGETQGRAFGPSGRTGRSYVNVGDPYETTLYVCTDYDSARFYVGLQGA